MPDNLFYMSIKEDLRTRLIFFRNLIADIVKLIKPKFLFEEVEPFDCEFARVKLIYFYIQSPVGASAVEVDESNIRAAYRFALIFRAAIGKKLFAFFKFVGVGEHLEISFAHQSRFNGLFALQDSKSVFFAHQKAVSRIFYAVDFYCSHNFLF